MFSVGCLLAGHNDMVVREAGRMWLRCQRCGRDTPGWSVGGIATTVQAPPPMVSTASPLLSSLGGRVVLFIRHR